MFENLSGADLLIGFILSVIVFAVVVYFIPRWVFAIKRQLWNQQQQINLLIMIAKKIGVENVEELDGIEKENNGIEENPEPESSEEANSKESDQKID